MFGKNKIERQKLDDGNQLRIVKGSPWLTIQGEGPYAGHPAIFIRLHGCPLRCTFCDTNFDDPDDPVVDIKDLLMQPAFNSTANLVVITGGEPTNQNIIPLCKQLHFLGYKIQIETAGVGWVPGLEQYGIEMVCSPKTPHIHPQIFSHAIAFKYVISEKMSFDGFVPITATQPNARQVKLASPRPGAPVYLSPMDEYEETTNVKNRKLVAQMAIKYGCIAGLQLHKFMEVD